MMLVSERLKHMRRIRAWEKQIEATQGKIEASSDPYDIEYYENQVRRHSLIKDRLIKELEEDGDMTVKGDEFRINNWIRYWRHEKNKAILMIDDIRLEIANGGDKKILTGGIKYYEYQIAKYDASIDKLRKELEGL